MIEVRRRRHPALNAVMFVSGGLLILATPLVALLPGPGGVFTFAAGLALLLRTSQVARKRFARAKRRFPKTGDLVDRGMRRTSARRRRERARLS
jgi:hypothetical protein